MNPLIPAYIAAATETGRLAICDMERVLSACGMGRAWRAQAEAAARVAAPVVTARRPLRLAPTAG